MRFGGVLQIETDPYPIGWAALVVFDQLAVRAGSFDQKRSGAIARLDVPGAFRAFGAVMLGLSLGGSVPRISILPEQTSTALEPTKQAQARQGGLIWGRASIVPAMGRRWIRSLSHSGLASASDFLRDCSAPCRQIGRALRCRITAMSSGFGRLAMRDQEGVKPGDAIYQGACDAMLARELIRLIGTQLHRYSRARRWPPAAGHRDTAYTKLA